jgi:hypothetical protein
MTREEAARELEKLRSENYMDDYDHFGESEEIAIGVALAALRGPVPDPETGLVPCGCGGKAQLGKLQYTIADPDLMPEYYAYCQDCGITTENSADRERVEAAWNRAMGYRA